FESLYLGSRHTPWPRRRDGRHLPGARCDGERLHRDDVDLVRALLHVLRHGEAIGDAPGHGHQQAGQVLEGQVRLRTSKNMPSQVWETTWSWLLKDGAGLLILDPYGGEMVRVVPAVTPFPHRQALYNIQYYGFWSKSGRQRRRSTWAGSEGSTVRWSRTCPKPQGRGSSHRRHHRISRRLPLLARGNMAPGAILSF
ncbi:Os08g0137050, partial [Oryza sativa Japonica Group]